jgi:hypothetical protein
MATVADILNFVEGLTGAANAGNYLTAANNLAADLEAVVDGVDFSVVNIVVDDLFNKVGCFDLVHDISLKSELKTLLIKKLKLFVLFY